MRELAACAVCWIALSLLTLIALPFSWLSLVSTALTVVVLYLASKAADARGWQLFGLLASLSAGIGVINIQLESLVFRILTPVDVAKQTVIGVAEAAAIAAVLAWAVTGRQSHGSKSTTHHLARSLWLRVPLLAVLYIVLYLTAGALIFPYIREFYATSSLLTIPSFGVIIGTQFVRGLIYAAALAPFLRAMEGRRLHAAVVAGLSLAILGGLAPLLLPVDDVFPMEIRRFHMAEIFMSNFLLGVAAAYLLVRRKPKKVTEAVIAGT